MKGNIMASPRKKKMAKYMIDDLLAIAKKQIITLNPCLDLEAVLQKNGSGICRCPKGNFDKTFSSR